MADDQSTLKAGDKVIIAMHSRASKRFANIGREEHLIGQDECDTTVCRSFVSECRALNKVFVGAQDWASIDNA